MTTVATKTPRQVRRDHSRAAEFLSLLESKANIANDVLLPLHEDAAYQLLDEDERDALNKACNALHDLASAAEHLARFRRSQADRADWTAADWSTYELVLQNID